MRKLDEEQWIQKSLQTFFLNEHGEELPDPTPMAPPVGYKRQPSMVEIVRDMVRSERLRQELEGTEAESFEESEDFDVGDDYDPASQYENEFDPPIEEIRREVEAERERQRQTVPAKPAEPAEDRMVDPPSDGPGREKPLSDPPKGREDGKPRRS